LNWLRASGTGGQSTESASFEPLESSFLSETVGMNRRRAPSSPGEPPSLTWTGAVKAPGSRFIPPANATVGRTRSFRRCSRHYQLSASITGGSGVRSSSWMWRTTPAMADVLPHITLGHPHSLHGTPGQVSLGTAISTPLPGRYGRLSAGAGLARGGDILLYSCFTAQGDSTLSSSIANLTGADVAASDDLTAGAELGATGCWVPGWLSGGDPY
jgi:hypothetical protein